MDLTDRIFTKYCFHDPLNGNNGVEPDNYWLNLPKKSQKNPLPPAKELVVLEEAEEIYKALTFEKLSNFFFRIILKENNVLGVLLCINI